MPPEVQCKAVKLIALLMLGGNCINMFLRVLIQLKVQNGQAIIHKQSHVFVNTNGAVVKSIIVPLISMLSLSIAKCIY